MLRKRTFFLALLLLIPLSFTLMQCFNNPPAEDSRGPAYAGSETCIKCHSSVYNSYIHTAHFQTSQPSALANIQGSFNKDSNTYAYTNEFKVRMENHNDSLFQVGYDNGNETVLAPFNITIGGVKAQTYLYWRENQLFQLPISYFAGLHSWANSPGYASDQINFNRLVYRRCLECHSSNVNMLAQETGEPGFDKASLIYGIDCERCHGPAAKHVNFHTEHPDEKTAKFITTYSSLTRAQKMDACGVCHSVNKTDYQKNTFQFKMGDTLSKFKPTVTKLLTPDSLDVHVNQNALLSASKCFIATNMDCSTCHDTHVNQRQNISMFTQKCLNCHSEAKHNFCTLAPQMSTAALKTYCVNCHMPQKDSHIIKLDPSQGIKGTPYLVRTHRIAIYPDETKKIMAFVKGQTTSTF